METTHETDEKKSHDRSALCPKAHMHHNTELRAEENEACSSKGRTCARLRQAIMNN